MPNEFPRRQECFSLSAILSDAVDGVLRLLTDIAKFGFRILELHVVSEAGGEARVLMRIATPRGTDAANISSRLARHVCVITLRVA